MTFIFFYKSFRHFWPDFVCNQIKKSPPTIEKIRYVNSNCIIICYFKMSLPIFAKMYVETTPKDIIFMFTKSKLPVNIGLKPPITIPPNVILAASKKKPANFSRLILSFSFVSFFFLSPQIYHLLFLHLCKDKYYFTLCLLSHLV